MPVSDSHKFRQKLFSVSRSLMLIAGIILSQTNGSGQSSEPRGQGLQPVLAYISTAWDTLTRSVTDCQSIVDPKVKEAPVLYLPAGTPKTR